MVAVSAFLGAKKPRFVCVVSRHYQAGKQGVKRVCARCAAFLFGCNRNAAFTDCPLANRRIAGGKTEPFLIDYENDFHINIGST
jgi:hypothetical protein